MIECEGQSGMNVRVETRGHGRKQYTDWIIASYSILFLFCAFINSRGWGIWIEVLFFSLTFI